MFCTGGSVPYSGRIEAKENLFSCLFVNANLSEERIKVLLSEKELSELPGDSPNIFQKSNIDHYVERPRATFCNGKNSVLEDFCYAEFLAYYTLTLQNKSSKTCEYQPDDNVISH